MIKTIRIAKLALVAIHGMQDTSSLQDRMAYNFSKPGPKPSFQLYDSHPGNSKAH